MGRKKTVFSQNPETNDRIAEWRRKWEALHEAELTGSLAPPALKRNEQELEREGYDIARVLMEENEQGKLTRYGAEHIAKAYKGYTTTAKNGDATTHHTYASNNRVRHLTITGVRRKEIDTKQLAKIYLMQAERKVKERREKGEATDLTESAP